MANELIIYVDREPIGCTPVSIPHSDTNFIAPTDWSTTLELWGKQEGVKHELKLVYSHRLDNNMIFFTVDGQMEITIPYMDECKALIKGDKVKATTVY